VTATSAKINPGEHLPDHVSPAQIKGLLSNVDVWRDAWGIPHVRGGSYQDAFAGLGFAQAQDRLWQMEALLRRGTGRYAEWLGARAVAGDVIARQMNGAAASRRDFALLGDEARRSTLGRRAAEAGRSMAWPVVVRLGETAHMLEPSFGSTGAAVSTAPLIAGKALRRSAG